MLIIILFLVTVILGGSWFAYRKAFYSPAHNRPAPDTPLQGEQYDVYSGNIRRIAEIMSHYSCEEVWIESFDGTRLLGRYYHFRDNAPIQLLFHGYRSHAFRDCSGGHSLCKKLGYNVFVPDQRAQGNSGGRTITFGIKERIDCLCWIRYLSQRFGSDIPIILSGLSMGAATVLMAAGLDLPENVACIIADSPYSAPMAIIEKVARDQHYPVSVCRPFAYLGARMFGGFSLGSCTAKDAVRHSKVPILLLHGEDDRMVPCSMSLEIAACCTSNVKVVTFPDAGHGLCYVTDPIRYEHAVCSFLNSIPAIKNTFPENLIRKPNDNS